MIQGLEDPSDSEDTYNYHSLPCVGSPRYRFFCQELVPESHSPQFTSELLCPSRFRVTGGDRLNRLRCPSVVLTELKGSLQITLCRDPGVGSDSVGTFVHGQDGRSKGKILGLTPVFSTPKGRERLRLPTHVLPRAPTLYVCDRREWKIGGTGLNPETYPLDSGTSSTVGEDPGDGNESSSVTSGLGKTLGPWSSSMGPDTLPI